MTAVAAPALEPSVDAARFRMIRLTHLLPSKTNPRTHFDPAYIEELAGSVREKGIIQPIIVRPRPVEGIDDEAFEIVAGECRYRAAHKAGIAFVPAIVRPYTDEQVLEVQLIENIHRTDLTPLEQAAGYRRLIDTNPTKHNVDTIAQRVGMSASWVWDRLKLNDLVPEAKHLLEQERFTLGHAIVLARLKPEDQARALNPDASGLWTYDEGRLELEEKRTGKPGKYDDLKPVSIREFETWVREHVRFDVKHAAQAQPLVFEQIARDVEHAAALPGRGRKVISITREYRVADDARAADGERTFGSQSWRRADGAGKSKTCEYSVLGVFVAGDDYGKTMQVCVNRDKCTAHFGDVIKDREKNQRLRETGQAGKAAKNEASQRAREEEKRKADEAREQAARAAWRKAGPSLIAALTIGVKRAKTGTLGRFHLHADDKAAVSVLGAPKTGDDYLRVFTLSRLIREVRNEYWGPKNLPKLAKAFGVDVAAAVLQAQAAPAAKGTRAKR